MSNPWKYKKVNIRRKTYKYLSMLKDLDGYKCYVMYLKKGKVQLGSGNCLNLQGMELVALNNIIMISSVEQRRDEKVFQEYYLDLRYSTYTLVI